MVAGLGSSFLLLLASPRIGAIVFLAVAVLSFLVPFLYGLAGLIVIPFRDSIWSGVLCWTCLPYLLGYTWRRRDVMAVPFLNCVGSFGVIILMAIVLPGMAALNMGHAGAVGPSRRAALRRSASGNARRVRHSRVSRPGKDGPRRGVRGNARRSPRSQVSCPETVRPPLPPPAQPPAMTASITLKVTGFNNQAAEKTFGEQLNKLVQRVSGGYQLSFSSTAGRSNISISMQNTISVQAVRQPDHLGHCHQGRGPDHRDRCIRRGRRVIGVRRAGPLR